MMKHIMNNRGFSILELTVAAGLLGFVGMMGMQIQKSSTSNLLMQDSTILSQSIATQIENYLETVGSCTQTLGGQNATVDSPITQIKDKSGIVVFSTGKEYDGVVLNSMRLLHPVTGNATRLDPVTHIGFMDLEAKFLRKEKSMGTQEVTRKIRLWVLTDAANVIQRCSVMTMSSDNLWRRSYWDAAKIFYTGGRVGVGAPVGAYNSSSLIVTGGRIQAANTAGNRILLESSDGTNSFKIRTRSDLPVVFANESTGTTIDTRMNSLTVHMAVQPGPSTDTCSAATTGAIRYNPSANRNQICGMAQPTSATGAAVYRWMSY